MFEYPYNFDFDELFFLKEYYPQSLEKVSYIFIPAFYQHSDSTRKGYDGSPTDIKEYERHIRGIQYLGFDIAILFQDYNKILDDSIIRYYTDYLNIDNFIINRDDVADKVRNIKPESFISASILKRLSDEQIFHNDELYLYDNIVLPFKYTTELDLIKELPKNKSYTLLVNSICGPDDLELCQKHWSNELYVGCMGKNLNGKYIVHPGDLEKYNPYIKYFKLQGRDYIGGHRQADIWSYLFYGLEPYDYEKYVHYGNFYYDNKKLDEIVIS